MHPHLDALLAEQRRMSCPCGARIARPGSLCRKCHHTAQWRRHNQHAKRTDRTARRLARHSGQIPALLSLVLFFRGPRP